MGADLVVAILMIYLTGKATSGQPKPGCAATASCGSLSIPYPFGTTPGCSFDESFLVDCNNTKNGNGSGEKKKAFFPKSNIAILNISVADHEVRVESPVARDCYNDQAGNLTDDGTTSSMVTLSKFPISSRHNIFTAVGCDIVGLIQYDPNDNNETSKTVGNNIATGCFSFCNRFENLQNGTCAGAGCCQISIPTDVIDFVTYTVRSVNNRSDVTKFNNPCGYAFVVEKDEFNFSTLDLQNLQNRQTLPVVLDWAVGNQTCQQVQTNPKSPSYACQSNYSECHQSNNGPGYICKCRQGFQGNPYLVDGCQDIDECETSSPCINTAKCNNVPGSVNCICPNGNIGDGMRNGTGCTRKNDSNQSLAIGMGISICLLVLVVGFSWIYWGIKKRKFIRLKEKFFKKNGGILFQQQLSNNRRRSVEIARIFTAEELKKATNNYDDSRVLGQGGFGTVYKGILSDNKVVAIKKSKVSDQNQIEQFINEVIVLSQINHRNVVKLLGCCLETEVPLLVYEFITNGTLYSHIHDRTRYPSPLSWELRLKIAIETAGALSYLHSETCIPIIHRDVKTANILLDDNYTAKVSDFGASRLIPIDQTELTTLVRGTFGYLDPEYSQSSQLTEKSDVYSFGVVLVELLTGKKALCFSRPENQRNLAIYFVSYMKEDRFTEILDGKVAVNEEIINQLKEVAILANKCLSLKGEERPTMKEATTELEAIIN